MHWIYFWFALSLTSALCARPLTLDVNAKSAILINADNGALLFEKEAHLPSFPASITKVATLLYVLEKQPDLQQMVTVSAASMKMKPKKDPMQAPSYFLEFDGTKMGIQVGETLSIESLLHGLILVSGNDAANVLAETVSGSIPRFLEELNAYLKSLGCSHTHFCNPHGLHHPDHQTTAHDMALITRRALQFPTFRTVLSKVLYLKPQTNKQPQAEMKHTNRLLRPGPHYYSKAMGGKTGYTSLALHTLVAVAEQEGRRLIAVLLGCDKQDHYSEAKKLFEAAFAEPRIHRVLLRKGELYSRAIEGATAPLEAILSQELAMDYYLAEEPSLKAVLRWEVPALPIQQGSKVGEACLIDEKGRVVMATPLIAKSEVKGTLLFMLKKRWAGFLGGE